MFCWEDMEGLLGTLKDLEQRDMVATCSKQGLSVPLPLSLCALAAWKMPRQGFAHTSGRALDLASSGGESLPFWVFISDDHRWVQHF